ncbi:MAG: plasmid replication initiator TrfA [Mariprofundaceae bacterium]|nr:plasmid replication initiator TrfA [Mariprofundaceae bacterium]
MPKKNKFSIPESVQRELDEKEKKVNPSPRCRASDVPDKAISLGVWPDSKSSVPTGFGRSALFGVVKRGQRKYLQQEPIAAWKDWSIKYTGQQLAQVDLDMLLVVANMSKDVKGTVRTSYRALLRASGRKGTGARDIEWLQITLDRMTACALTVKHKSKSYHGNIMNWAEDEKTGDVIVWMNEHQSWLWQDATWIDTEQRHSLKLDLSKWLQSYVCSHQAIKKKPHMLSLSKLQELCGSHNKQLAGFRRKVKAAMAELEESGAVLGWDLEKDDVLKFWRK